MSEIPEMLVRDPPAQAPVRARRAVCCRFSRSCHDCRVLRMIREGRPCVWCSFSAALGCTGPSEGRARKCCDLHYPLDRFLRSPSVAGGCANEIDRPPLSGPHSGQPVGEFRRRRKIKRPDFAFARIMSTGTAILGNSEGGWRRGDDLIFRVRTDGTRGARFGEGFSTIWKAGNSWNNQQKHTDRWILVNIGS
jgi:hypothetical protein